MSSDLSDLDRIQPVVAEGKSPLDSAATGAVIVQARARFDIAQKALAIEMGITQPYLSDLEYGRRLWHPELFERARAALKRLVKA